VISACWRLMHHDVKISGSRIRTHDLWIRKRVCYPLHHSAPQGRSRFRGPGPDLGDGSMRCSGLNGGGILSWGAAEVCCVFAGDLATAPGVGDCWSAPPTAPSVASPWPCCNTWSIFHTLRRGRMSICAKRIMFTEINISSVNNTMQWELT